MRIIECSVVAKTGNPEESQDGAIVTDDFAAVVDGATDKSGRTFDGVSGGRFAMTVVMEAIGRLNAEADCAQAVTALTAALAAALPDRLPPVERPGAVAVIYSAARRELWKIGDVGFWYAGLPHEQDQKPVDVVASAMRAAVIRAELISGTTVEELTKHDTGREAIMPLLRRQTLFANNPAAGDLAFAVLDGRTVPQELVTSTRVPSNVTELVLASDGYPEILRTLAESEKRVREMMAADPLCVDVLRGTKGLTLAGVGFDDRSYLRLEI
ncbi:hypothetical protein G3I34_29970 [Streptomyces sp. SID8014]|uniref:hypothetical protein n=1 Tax=Streptomyces sp. SID8014 TaxID=2706097 RepID=UPI0013B97892|nr:hypothetical protein [Streptomyces sp. SID8014]NEC16422.1 hypothetical protein [Streptomyces sp. SID8014]